jgi:hypothetical protein
MKFVTSLATREDGYKRIVSLIKDMRARPIPNSRFEDRLPDAFAACSDDEALASLVIAFMTEWIKRYPKSAAKIVIQQSDQ